jgi:transposase
MQFMPKKIDEQLKTRAVRLVTEHQQEYPNLTAACEAVARQVGVGKESVRRWVRQAEVDGGHREGKTSEELTEIRELRSKVRRLEEDNAILKAATVFFVGELDPRNR